MQHFSSRILLGMIVAVMAIAVVGCCEPYDIVCLILSALFGDGG
jgi:hypothetical protein